MKFFFPVNSNIIQVKLLIGPKKKNTNKFQHIYIFPKVLRTKNLYPFIENIETKDIVRTITNRANQTKSIRFSIGEYTLRISQKI